MCVGEQESCYSGMHNHKLSYTCIQMCINWNQKANITNLIFLCCASCRAAVVTIMDILCMCVCMCDAEQESCYSVMNICALNFMCCANCTCVCLASNVIIICRCQRQKPGTIPARQNSFWAPRQCISLRMPCITYF